MERLPVSPTKSNLIRLRDELAFAREGKDLLTQKRQVLIMELLRLQDDARRAREEFEAILAQAYRSFATAAMLAGYEAMARLAPASGEPPGVTVRERSVMGVILPIVSVEEQPWRLEYGSAGVPLAADQAAGLMREAVKKLLEVAEIETAIYRLAMETRKTLRRERALENLFIPQYAATVKFIQENLEERERESFYQLKLLKGR